jgi:hypothetical protein
MASIIHKINSISTKIEEIKRVDLHKNSIMLKIDSLLSKLPTSTTASPSTTPTTTTTPDLVATIPTLSDGDLVATILTSDNKFDDDGNKLETEENKIKTIRLLFKKDSNELEASDSSKYDTCNLHHVNELFQQYYYYPSSNKFS